MIIIEPTPMTDAQYTRVGTATYFNDAGAFQIAAANVLRVSYNPADLTAPPMVLLEAAATNLLLRSSDFANAAWTKTGSSVTAGPASSRVSGGILGKLVESAGSGAHSASQQVSKVASPLQYTASFVTKAAERTLLLVQLQGSVSGSADVTFDLSAGTASATAVSGGFSGAVARISARGNGEYLCELTATSNADTGIVLSFGLKDGGGASSYTGDGVSGLYLADSQLEAGPKATSRIVTTSAAVTRAADVIGNPSGTLLSSNVAEDEYPPYAVGTTFGLDAYCIDLPNHLVYRSLVTGNLGNALTDDTKWQKIGYTNRWRMIDQYNSTVTSNANSIVHVFTPNQIAQGVYLAGVEGDEVTTVVQDRTSGVVYSETQSQIVSNSSSSFYRWIFSRIRRKTFFISVMLPPYFDAIVTIIIKKPGGTAKCSMCVLGPLMDIGLSLYGLAAEIKDYSTTKFDFDGTSTSVERGYAKRLSVDVIVYNENLDYVYELLAGYRQKNVVYVGSVLYGMAIAFGKLSSFKLVIPELEVSKMAAQIEGTV